MKNMKLDEMDWQAVKKESLNQLRQAIMTQEMAQLSLEKAQSELEVIWDKMETSVALKHIAPIHSMVPTAETQKQEQTMKSTTESEVSSTINEIDSELAKETEAKNHEDSIKESEKTDK